MQHKSIHTITLAFALFSTLSAPQAHAIRTQKKGPSCKNQINAVQQATESRFNLPHRNALIDGYITAFETKCIAEARWEGLIIDRIFGSEDYESVLLEIDALSQRRPKAIMNLAKSLQGVWEARHFLPRYGNIDLRMDQLDARAKVGFIAGLAVLGATTRITPDKMPKYFRVMRHFLPLMGTIAGPMTTSYSFSSYFDSTPKAPAEIMSLSLDDSEFNPDHSVFVEDVASLAAGLGATTLAIQVLRGVRIARIANAAITPLKINPFVLVGSFVVFYAAEKGAVAGVKAYDQFRLKKQLRSAMAEFSDADTNGYPYEVAYKARKLMKAMTMWHFYIYRPIHEAREQNKGENADFIENTQHFKKQQQLSFSALGLLKNAQNEELVKTFAESADALLKREKVVEEILKGLSLSAQSDHMINIQQSEAVR